jgi:hypothetical protein
MELGKTAVLPRLTVLSSQVFARPDGRVAIALETKENGTLAFEVDQHAIDTLRRDLAVAETFLCQPDTRN